MFSRTLTYFVASLLLIMSLANSPAKADTIFDQTNTALPLGTLCQNVLVFSPLGQSFTPTLTSLNFVNLLTVGGSATVQVNILSISGKILGTSQPTAIPFSMAPSMSSFSFSAPVTLNQGQAYIMQPIVVSGATLVGSTNANTYSGGTQILCGIPQPNNDLWFQEGVSVPEPGALLLLGVGIIGLLSTSFFRRR